MVIHASAGGWPGKTGVSAYYSFYQIQGHNGSFQIILNTVKCAS